MGQNTLKLTWRVQKMRLSTSRYLVLGGAVPWGTVSYYSSPQIRLKGVLYVRKRQNLVYVPQFSDRVHPCHIVVGQGRPLFLQANLVWESTLVHSAQCTTSAGKANLVWERPRHRKWSQTGDNWGRSTSFFFENSKYTVEKSQTLPNWGQSSIFSLTMADEKWGKWIFHLWNGSKSSQLVKIVQRADWKVIKARILSVKLAWNTGSGKKWLRKYAEPLLATLKCFWPLLHTKCAFSLNPPMSRFWKFRGVFPPP